MGSRVFSWGFSSFGRGGLGQAIQAQKIPIQGWLCSDSGPGLGLSFDAGVGVEIGQGSDLSIKYPTKDLRVAIRITSKYIMLII